MPRRTAPHRSRAPRGRRGFTLLETSLTMMIVTVGVLAIMEAQTSFVRCNSWSSHAATAAYLANEIRERVRTLPRHDPVLGMVILGSGSSSWVGLDAGENSIDDMDDIDDYNTVIFASNGTQAFLGPIDAFGNVIPEVDPNGFVVTSGGEPVPLIGWTQKVDVSKVNQYKVNEPLDWDYVEPAALPFPGIAVDEFALRVTVTVLYQGPFDPAPLPVTVVSWIEPAR